jgi:hypothetical protein
MGRGRQKAKQTKVARRLKYYSPDTDYDALQRELTGPDGHGGSGDLAAGLNEDLERDDDVDVEDEDSGYGSWTAEQNR